MFVFFTVWSRTVCLFYYSILRRASKHDFPCALCLSQMRTSYQGVRTRARGGGNVPFLRCTHPGKPRTMLSWKFGTRISDGDVPRTFRRSTRRRGVMVINEKHFCYNELSYMCISLLRTKHRPFGSERDDGLSGILRVSRV
jgi:hypothetical protein